MKIAFATQDGQTISRHFGRAPHYLVTIENGAVAQRELRDKASHAHHEHTLHQVGEERHGYGGQAQALLQ